MIACGSDGINDELKLGGKGSRSNGSHECEQESTSKSYGANAMPERRIRPPQQENGNGSDEQHRRQLCYEQQRVHCDSFFALSMSALSSSSSSRLRRNALGSSKAATAC